MDNLLIDNEKKRLPQYFEVSLFHFSLSIFHRSLLPNEFGSLINLCKSCERRLDP